MQRTFRNILAAGLLMNLAAYGQAASGQASNAQAANGQASNVQPSYGQGSYGAGQGLQVPGSRLAGGQSLGEVARQLRESQKPEETTAVHPKVITNQDLGEGPEGRPDLRQAPRMASFERGSGEFDRRYGQQGGMGDQHAGEWRNRILEQKSRVTSLQERINEINAQLHSGAQFEGPGNRYQARQMEHVAQMQVQLDEQRRRLEEMQDAARRAGMHTTVYDP
jgi:hypothetical protein